MIPTLVPGDRVLVSKFWYHFQPPKRGQIVVFKYPLDPKRDFIKRVIGLPGEVVSMEEGVVYIDGEPLAEPYVKNHDSFNMKPVRVPENAYFVMGDNRPNSQDSRFWGFVPKENLIGPAFFRYWPLSRIGGIY
jgi:signal peptidase I